MIILTIPKTWNMFNITGLKNVTAQNTMQALLPGLRRSGLYSLQKAKIPPTPKKGVGET